MKVHRFVRRRRAALALACVAALCAAAASGAGAAAGARTGAVTVKIACDRELSEVFLWDLARFAKPYGISPQCVQIQSFNESLQAVTNGSVDLGVLGYPEIPTVASKRLPLKIVAGYTNGGENVIVRTGETITRWSQFAGKAICVPQGTGVVPMIDIALTEQHVDLTKVKIQGIGFVTTAAIQALQNGSCDALAYWSPVVDQAVADKAGHYVPTIDLNKATSLGPADGVVVANPRLYKNRPLMVGFLKAYVASMTYYKAHPQEWASTAAEVTGAPVALLAAALRHQEATYHVDLKAGIAAAKYGPRFGYATSDVSAKVRGVIDVSFLSAATGQSQATLLERVPWKGEA